MLPTRIRHVSRLRTRTASSPSPLSLTSLLSVRVQRPTCGSEGRRMRWRLARTAAGVIRSPLRLHARFHGARCEGATAVVSWQSTDSHAGLVAARAGAHRPLCAVLLL